MYLLCDCWRFGGACCLLIHLDIPGSVAVVVI
jgi:hypothetical protein